MGEKVTLHVYDLSQGMARAFSSAILGKSIEGIWHTGVVVYGVEYFFGGGIQADVPAQTAYGRPSRVVELGRTEVPQEVFQDFLREISPRFTVQTYSLLYHNCNTFTNECSLFLTGNPIPTYITGLPQEVLSTPMGAMLAPMLTQFEQQMKAQVAHPVFPDAPVARSSAIPPLPSKSAGPGGEGTPRAAFPPATPPADKLAGLSMADGPDSPPLSHVPPPPLVPRKSPGPGPIRAPDPEPSLPSKGLHPHLNLGLRLVRGSASASSSTRPSRRPASAPPAPAPAAAPTPPRTLTRRRPTGRPTTAPARPAAAPPADGSGRADGAARRPEHNAGGAERPRAARGPPGRQARPSPSAAGARARSRRLTPPPQRAAAVERLVARWPASALFPVLYLLRLLVVNPSANQHYVDDKRDLVSNVLRRCLGGEGEAVPASVPKAAQLMALCLATNMFASKGGAFFMTKAPRCALVVDVASRCLASPDPSIRTTAAALAYNCSIYLPKDDSDAAVALLAALVHALQQRADATHRDDSEAVYRMLLAVGHLVFLNEQVPFIQQRAHEPTARVAAEIAQILAAPTRPA
eukprot:tig00000405_g448.t1